MRYKIFIPSLFMLLSSGLFAQQSDTQHIRVVDTLTAKERTSRNAVILKSELDSLIMVYNTAQQPGLQKESLHAETDDPFKLVIAGIAAIIALLGFGIYLFFRQQQQINKAIAVFKEQAKQNTADKGQLIAGKEKKGKFSPLLLEGKINDLYAELHKLTKENENLNKVIKEYNGIQHDYDSLKHGILKSYKVKNYPGYDKSRNELIAMQSVLDTENIVANYAYEKFLKPILAITDVNKNSPARLADTDREKLLDLLVSLSLLYIEYLYLRVNDLSIGGKMVERIKGFAGGNGIDNSLLKKLNSEFGSRALVIKMALNKAGMQRLTYPVFDETNLNNQ